MTNWGKQEIIDRLYRKIDYMEKDIDNLRLELQQAQEALADCRIEQAMEMP